jgi:hypothetical protein
VSQWPILDGRLIAPVLTERITSSCGSAFERDGQCVVALSGAVRSSFGQNVLSRVILR